MALLPPCHPLYPSQTNHISHSSTFPGSRGPRVHGCGALPWRWGDEVIPPLVLQWLDDSWWGKTGRDERETDRRGKTINKLLYVFECTLNTHTGYIWCLPSSMLSYATTKLHNQTVKIAASLTINTSVTAVTIYLTLLSPYTLLHILSPVQTRATNKLTHFEHIDKNKIWK